MIGFHCGVRLVTHSRHPTYFEKRCPACGRVFKQRVRLATTELERIAARLHEIAGERRHVHLSRIADDLSRYVKSTKTASK